MPFHFDVFLVIMFFVGFGSLSTRRRDKEEGIESRLQRYVTIPNGDKLILESITCHKNVPTEFLSI